MFSSRTTAAAVSLLLALVAVILFAAFSIEAKNNKKQDAEMPSESSSSTSPVDLFLSGLIAFRDFMAPPPLSPLFQKGGIFYGYNEDIVQIILLMGVLGICDLLFVQSKLLVKSGSSSARYYFLHSIANAISTVTALPGLYRIYNDPVNCMSGKSHTQWSNSAVASIHIYHCIAFSLNAGDIFHHLVFAASLCGLAIPFKNVAGICNTCGGCLILSGLPGCIDYILLTLVKEGRMEKFTEKRWNAAINTWCRGPTMAMYFMLAWVNWRSGEIGRNGQIHWTVFLTNAVLHFWNGALYAGEVNVSYGQYLERRKLEKAANKSGFEDPASPASPVPPGSAKHPDEKNKKKM